MWAEDMRLLGQRQKTSLFITQQEACASCLCPFPWTPEFLKGDMEMDPGGCCACSGFASQLRHPSLFIKGLPNLCSGGRHYLYSPGQPVNLLSAPLSLSSNAVGYTDILVKIGGNKGWYKMCRNVGVAWIIVSQ